MKNILKTTIKASIVAASLLYINNSALAKNLIFCSEASPEGFDPALYSAGVTFDASSKPIYNRLLEFEKGTTNLVPALAESYEISPDGLEYVFHLRKGVKFHTTKYFTPTRDFNADDVIFSFDRQWKQDNPWHDYTNGVAWLYFDSMEIGPLLKNIEKIDDYTVKITLNRPEAPFLADMAMDFASILSKEYADQLQKQGKMPQLNLLPIGTGPFVFVAYQKDAVIRYKANNDYYKGKQPIDNLIFAITKDPAVRTQKLKVGECDIIPYPSPSDLPELRADKNVNVLQKPGLTLAYIAYNTQQKPFDNPKVRRALNMAINKQTIIDAVYQGNAQPEKNPMPPTLWSYDNAIPDDVYDPEAAKKILDEEGIKDLTITLWAMPVSSNNMPNGRRTAELMQNDWQKIGVNSNIISMEWGEYLRSAKQIDRDGMVMMGWAGDNGDPDNFIGILNSCASIGTNNYANWCYKPFDDIIKQAKIVSDKAERTKLYQQAQVIFKEQSPSLILASPLMSAAMKKTVKNYVIEPLGAHRFDGVDIEE